MKDENKIDGRSLRQKTIYDESQLKLIQSAIELLQDPDIDHKDRDFESMYVQAYK